jgi:hypothetical protein
LTDPKTKDYARQISVLFKKKTDGRNADITEIAPANVRGFYFQNKISLAEVFEALQLLQLRNLIMSSTNTPTYYQLTSLGNRLSLTISSKKSTERSFDNYQT